MPADSDRRRELRVPLPIQLWFNILESYDDYIRAPQAPSTGLEPPESVWDLGGNDELSRFLIHLDKKLDLVISLLSDSISRKDYQHKGQAVDVSESGFRLYSPINLAPGAVLEMGLALPSQPFRTMDILGEVVWEQSPNGFDSPLAQKTVGVTFRDILEVDREEIVHYIFQKQREELRRRKGD